MNFPIANTKEFEIMLVAALPRMKRFAFSLCRNHALADDLLQSACLRAIGARETWLPGSNFDGWMFRIVRNLWIDTLRHKKVASEVDDAVEDIPEISGNDGRKIQHQRLQLQKVKHAIMTLPDDLREVLVLVCVEDQSYKETADILGVPIGTVMSRLNRARKKLLEMTDYEAHDEDEE